MCSILFVFGYSGEGAAVLSAISAIGGFLVAFFTLKYIMQKDLDKRIESKAEKKALEEVKKDLKGKAERIELTEMECRISKQMGDGIEEFKTIFEMSQKHTAKMFEMSTGNTNDRFKDIHELIEALS